MPHVAIPNDLSGVVAGNLSGDSVNEYAYVWDGSDPGWTLNLRRWQYAELALVFAASGPSVKEIVALRSALPAYAARSAAEILSALRGCQRVALGTHLAFEAKGIASRCRGAGLTLCPQGRVGGRCFAGGTAPHPRTEDVPSGPLGSDTSRFADFSSQKKVSKVLPSFSSINAATISPIFVTHHGRRSRAERAQPPSAPADAREAPIAPSYFLPSAAQP